MNEGLTCDCCHTANAEYVVVAGTDATARGVLYCAKCSTATSAGLAPIHYADEAEGETLTGGEYVEYEGTIGVVSNRGGTIGRYSLRMPLGEVTTLRRSDFRVLFAEPQGEMYGRCETCGEPIDYCQGHGEIAAAVASGRPVYPEAGAPVPEEIRALGDDEPNRTQEYATKVADRERESAAEALRELIREGRRHLELLEAGRVRASVGGSHLNRQTFEDAERALVRWSLAAEIASVS